MQNDAAHELVEFSATGESSRFCGRHMGYSRLPLPLIVERAVELQRSTLRINDRFVGTGVHEIRVPLHLVVGATARAEAQGSVRVEVGAQRYEMRWDDPRWTLEIGSGREAAAYGRQAVVTRLEWRARAADLSLELRISPVGPASP